MSVNILGGEAAGLSLLVPPGNTIRPTSVLLKRRIFDSHQDFSEEIFVDLCAGSGAIGVEAWSRGAKKVYLVEASKNVFKVLGKNLSKLKSRFSADLQKRPVSSTLSDAYKWIQTFAYEYDGFDAEDKLNTIIFLDPPYGEIDLYKNIVLNELSKGWFKGELWIESDNQKGVKKSFWQGHGFEEIKSYKQGTSYIFKTKF